MVINLNLVIAFDNTENAIDTHEDLLPVVYILLIYKKRKRYRGIANAALNTSVFSFFSNLIVINLD